MCGFGNRRDKVEVEKILGEMTGIGVISEVRWRPRWNSMESIG